MRKTLLATSATLILGLVSGAPAVQAGTEAKPNIRDAAGDANAVNSQGGAVTGLGDGTGTPASVESGDILAVWLETGYDVVKDQDEAGNTTKVRHVAKSLKVNIKTSGPAKSFPGNGLIFRIPARIAGCNLWLEAWAKGVGATPLDLERADIRKLDATCPGGATTLTAGFTVSFTGNVITMEYPFASPSFAYPLQGFLGKGMQIKAAATNPMANSRIIHGGSVTAPALDETTLLAPFIVGTDLPADIDCIATPDAAACLA